jgi:predicted amidohydrolase
VQLKAGSDRAENLRRARGLIESAAAAGAELVVLPELFAWRGLQSDEATAGAEAIPGPSSELASELARRLGIHLVAGSILERGAAAGRCYNTSLLFGPDGALLGRYRKIHLFDVCIEGAVVASESRTRDPGGEPVCVETELGRIGMSICYDLRFPELFRRLADAGAEIVVLPAAFTAPTGAAHWHTLVRARAIENQCYVLAPNQFGPTLHGYCDYGHSLIVDPWGEVLAEGGDAREEVLHAALSDQRLAEVRRGLPSLANRRLPS